MAIYTKAFQLIGNTPILELKNIEKKENSKSHLLAKLECFNPTGSIKDRASYQMIKVAEEKGLIKEGGTIIEPTSGNTGIGLSSIGASLGYKVIIVMPDTMSLERRQMMKAYGAELVLTDGKDGMKGAIKKAEELLKSTPNSFMPSQFDNMANAEAHYLTTAPEIWNDLDGKIDIFISAVGTGGTLTGCARFFKEKNPNIKIVAVEPSDSPVLEGGKPGAHKIQGIGAGFIPSILDTSLIDQVISVTNEEAFECGKMISNEEGLLVGISSGAALSAALIISKKEEGKNIVIIMPDSGDRYLSSPMYL